MRWEAVFFDFDGVILDSVNVKTHAFAQMFRQYGPDFEKAVVQYHLENSGVSRYEKFRYYYEQLLQKSITDNELNELGREFSELVVQQVVESPFISGAYDTLLELYYNSIPAFIVSGTPEDEINLIVRKIGILNLFKEIHGSPRKKWEITSDIIARWNFNNERCLFVGDAISDYRAAEYNNISFLGIVAGNSNNVFPCGAKIAQSVNISLE